MKILHFISKDKKISRFSKFSQVFPGSKHHRHYSRRDAVHVNWLISISIFTDIYISVGCAVCPCCCDTADRRSPAGITAVVSYTARSYSCLAHSSCPATLDPRSSSYAPYRVC